jgi:hypothetical protein
LKRSDGSNSNFTLGTAALFVFFEKYLSPSSFNQLNTSDDKMIATLLKRLSHLGHINKYVNHVLGLLHVDIGSHGANKNLAAGGSSAPDPSAPHTMPVVIPNQNTPVHSQPVTQWLPLTMNVIDPRSQLLTLGSYMYAEAYKNVVNRLGLTQQQIIANALQNFVASAMTQIVPVLVNYLTKPGVLRMNGIASPGIVSDLTVILEGVVYEIQGDTHNQHPDNNYVDRLFLAINRLNQRGATSGYEAFNFIMESLIGFKNAGQEPIEDTIGTIYQKAVSWVNQNSVVIRRILSTSFPGISAGTMQRAIASAGNFIDEN